MIIDDNGVIVGGLSTAQTLGSFEFTGLMRTASTPEFSGDDPAKPYYMGYVKDEDIPSILHYCTWNVDTENGKIKVEQYHEDRPWAYAALQSTSVDMFGCGLANDGNGNWNYAAGTGGSYRVVPRLINAGIMARNTMSDDILIRFTEYLGTGVNTFKATYPQTYGYLWYTNLDNLQNFVDGNVTYTYASSFANTSITVSISDFDEYGVAHIPSTAGTLHLMIQGFNRCGRSNTEGNSFRILPFYRATIGTLNRYAYQFFDGFYSQGGNITEPVFYINRSSFAISSSVYSQSGQYMGLPEFELDTEQITNVVTNSNGLIAGPYFIRYYATAQYMIEFPVATIKEILKYANLSNKFQKGINYDGQNTITPTSSNTYTMTHSVALFNSDNSPKNERISENYGVTMIRKLQEWQLTGIDIKINSFDSDTDIPGGGGGGDNRPDPIDPGKEETGGDTVTLSDPSGIGGGFRFTTQYALRGSQLGQLGAKLWESFDTLQNYLDNFVYRVDPNTGSMNFSDVMDFFISLRMYPFPLGNIATITAVGNEMYVGSGITPITGFTAPLHILSEYVGIIDAGTLSLPFWFGDYRDFRSEITLYLPYCGTAELNPGDVLGGTLSCKYIVDFCTGACMAYVTCTTWENAELIVAQLPGQLGAEVPLTATNNGQIMARMYGDKINVAENLTGIVKTGLAGISALTSGNYSGAGVSALKLAVDPVIGQARLFAEQAGRGAIAAPMLSGGRGLAGFANPASAYIQIRAAFYPDIDNYGGTVGNPASEAVTIGDCTGFCRFVNVDVSSVTADAKEQTAIRQALENGVIL